MKPLIPFRYLSDFPSRRPVWAISLTGFAASVGQILMIRELLVLFYGNELSAGLVLAAWMLLFAGGSGLGAINARQVLAPESGLGLGIVALALVLPLSVIGVRAWPLAWDLPAGEMLAPAPILGMAFFSVAPFCLIAGFLFPLSWAGFLGSAPAKQSPLIYLGEALGAGVGGLCFYFLLLPHCSVLGAALGVSLILWAGVLPWFRPIRAKTGLIWGVGMAVLVTGFILGPHLDRMSRSWAWNAPVTATADTPYHNLVLTKEAGQFSLFANGLWRFSVPDPQTAQQTVHPALAQHPDPQQVLLIGGGASEIPGEILNHPVRRLDVPEPDAALIQMARAHLPPRIGQTLDSRRLRLIHQDPAAFIRQGNRQYDLILMTIGDPATAGTNRFYTLEFFQRIQAALAPDGIFCFSLSASPHVIGPSELRFLRSAYWTLSRVFDRILVCADSSARFFAANHDAALLKDPLQLSRVLEKRDIQADYTGPAYFFELLDPLGRDYLKRLLTEKGEARINRDFFPVCYFYHLIAWTQQMDSGLGRFFAGLSRISKRAFGYGLLLVCAGLAGIARLSRRQTQVAVLTLGIGLMIEHMVLMLGFQVLAGALYQEIALIIAAFMTGLAGGAAGVAGLTKRLLSQNQARTRLAWVQALMALHLAITGGLLVLLQKQSVSEGLPALFSLWALTAGAVGGVHFSLAVQAAPDPASAQAGGSLYAWDLVGGTLGALLSALFLLPVFGIFYTLMGGMGLVLAGWIGLKK